MARIGTPNLGLGTWLDGENPGAGSQTVDSTGSNGNMIKLDTAVGNEHNADGTHKANKIDKGNLKTTVADGSSIELNATYGLRVKAAGITAAMMGTNSIAVGSSVIQAKAIKAADLGDGCIDVGGLKIAAGALKTADYGAGSVDTTALKDANVTAAKMEYKFLKGYLNQAGSGDPALQVIKNTLGETPTLSRQTTGVYYLSTVGNVFTAASKIFCVISGMGAGGVAKFCWQNQTTLLITTYNFAGAAADSVLTYNTQILVEVYP